MRRLIVTVALAAVLACPMAEAKPAAPVKPCSAKHFRFAAKSVYLPWDQRISGKHRLRRLKRCAPNPRTIRGMRQAERQLVASRREARERMLCGTPACNRRLARYELRKRGDGDEWACLDSLGHHESGWDSYAVNPTSGAAGIPQALGHGHVFDLGDAPAQIDWFLDYVDERYGTPCAAWEFWLANGWY